MTAPARTAPAIRRVSVAAGAAASTATGAVAAGPVARRRLVARGVVQGVGFRPHVQRLADELGLAGTCRNDTTCVVIEVEGPSALLDEFARRLVDDAPPLAAVASLEAGDQPTSGAQGFVITASTSAPGGDGTLPRTLVPPDTAVCADCLGELRDPADRRYRHPFITCTNCGPRFTITRDLPYDRPATTMAAFAMCTACAAEYADPGDRRHHAQPIACHDCGPRLRLVGTDGATLATGTEASLRAAVAALLGGAIVAIKGIGGYHLACDATSCTAVTVLRERKHRPDQPFALMVRDLATAATLVDLGGAEGRLTARERPIVLLPRRADSATGRAPVADCVAPGLDELGVMLPYAPLHHLLFDDLPDGSPGAPGVLVMTSGNASGEPLCFTDEDALTRLGAIADVLLVHDREIAVPCEDSVLAWHEGTAQPVRRSRGYAPLPVALGDDPGVVLAAGAEVKNTVALARDGMAFVSAHIGDLGALESRRAYEVASTQLLRFHDRRPDLVVADLHPGYASRAWAQRTAADLGVPLLGVQHHHAHLAALAAEHHRLDEPMLGVVFDGTGYGCDGTVMGGEFLVLRDGGLAADRVAHLGTVLLPGADEGVRHPVRTAALAVLAAGRTIEGTPLERALTTSERIVLPGMLATGTSVVATSSVGRLFDVVSALLGVRGRISYEAQAAIELEAAAARWRREHDRDPDDGIRARLDLPVGVSPTTGLPALMVDPLIAALVDALRDGVSPARLASAFHVALASATAGLATAQASAAGLGTIGLSGGVFANRLLADGVRDMLRDKGFDVITHRLVPANDGGLSLGQVAVGVRELRRRRELPQHRRDEGV